LSIAALFRGNRRGRGCERLQVEGDLACLASALADDDRVDGVGDVLDRLLTQAASMGWISDLTNTVEDEASNLLVVETQHIENDVQLVLDTSQGLRDLVVSGHLCSP
jgi:hypothetical protein